MPLAADATEEQQKLYDEQKAIIGDEWLNIRKLMPPMKEIQMEAVQEDIKYYRLIRSGIDPDVTAWVMENLNGEVGVAEWIYNHTTDNPTRIFLQMKFNNSLSLYDDTPTPTA